VFVLTPGAVVVEIAFAHNFYSHTTRLDEDCRDTADLLAKACCSQGRLGAVSMPTLKEIDELRRLAAEQARSGD